MNANPQTPWADTITGMTPLRGSERQITWAEELRRSALWALREYYNDCRIEGMRAQGYNFPAGEIFSVEILNMVEDARWFIDHCRGCIHPLTVLRTLESTHNSALVALYARYAVQPPHHPQTAKETAMTGRNWIELINNNRQSILDQMRPHWADAADNRAAGLDTLLYLESDGRVTTHTRAAGSSDWRQGDHLLPLGDAFDTRPDEWQTEDEIIDNIITNNALYDW